MKATIHIQTSFASDEDPSDDLHEFLRKLARVLDEPFADKVWNAADIMADCHDSVYVIQSLEEDNKALVARVSELEARERTVNIVTDNKERLGYIRVVKRVRHETGLSLSEAKAMVDTMVRERNH